MSTTKLATEMKINLDWDAYSRSQFDFIKQSTDKFDSATLGHPVLESSLYTL